MEIILQGNSMFINSFKHVTCDIMWIRSKGKNDTILKTNLLFVILSLVYLLRVCVHMMYPMLFFLDCSNHEDML